ncbi:MAG TPA: hypothetical protein ENN99_04310 [Chloroflexi bacterium]|nr:hypothetical protein [Chloroflexota bacterium]
MTNKQQSKPSREQSIRRAYKAIEQMQLGEREAEVKLALKALLVIRGALNPAVIDETIYYKVAKYIRASNAETLSALVDDVLRNVSPEFISHFALGDPVQDVYAEESAPKARTLLQEEIIPLVILMKKVYQKYIEPEEATEEEQAEEEASHA